MEGSKWCYKSKECSEIYATTWLLIAHLKKVHGLIAKKRKPKHFSIHEGASKLESPIHECEDFK
jgi:hypothetical protein